MAKYIIIGLGNFGSALGQKLTAMGHEVIGVDISEVKVNNYSEVITHTIAMNACQSGALSTLPVKDADLCVVAIGEDFGASVLATALLKEHKARRIIARVISPVHKTVLSSIGVHQLIMPEEESADRLAKSLNISGVYDSFQLADGYSIVDAAVPSRYVGKSIEEIQLRKRYNLNIITIKKPNPDPEDESGFDLVGVISPDYKMEAGDHWVIFGLEEDLERVLGG